MKKQPYFLHIQIDLENRTYKPTHMKFALPKFLFLLRDSKNNFVISKRKCFDNLLELREEFRTYPWTKYLERF